MKRACLFILIIPFLNLTDKSLLNAQVCPVPEVFLGNDTLICPGDAFYLDAGTHDIITWSDGSTGQYFLVTEPGHYTVTVQNACGLAASDEINIDQAEVPEINLNLPPQDYYCKGELVNVTAEVINNDGSILYEWVDNNSNDATINVDTTGNYTVIATNEFGCKSSQEVYVEFQYPNEDEKILLVTYDMIDEKNVIIWSKTPLKRTQSYALYRGTSDSDLMGTTAFEQANIYVDPESYPQEKAHVYNLRVQDSCQNYSALRLEKAHRTMHLRASTNEKGNALLEWERYVGFDYNYFYLYRGTDPNSLELIDSVKHDPLQARMVYTDLTAKEGTQYYYIVKVNTPDTVYVEDPDARKAGNGPFVHSLSNLEDNLIRTVGMGELEYTDQSMKVFPNPVKAYTRISYRIDRGNDIKLSLYNLTGAEIARIVNAKQSPGEYEVTFNPSDHKLPPGIYILKMQVGNLGIVTRKLINNQ